jgi:hypothetical protein
MRKHFLPLVFILTVGLFLTGCTDVPATAQPAPDSFKSEAERVEETQKKVTNAVPIPQIDTSEERKNVAKRAELFNSENKISYIYLVGQTGRVMAFYTVKGKVSSLRSYMAPMDKLVDGNGEKCKDDYVGGVSSGYTYKPCYPVEAPDIDGTYGENVAGIFFFTTDGAYVEWNGQYLMSDQPMKLSTQPELVREVQ